MTPTIIHLDDSKQSTIKELVEKIRKLNEVAEQARLDEKRLRKELGSILDDLACRNNEAFAWWKREHYFDLFPQIDPEFMLELSRDFKTLSIIPQHQRR